MRLSIDRAGRVVIPKPVRDQLGFSPETPLEAELVDGRLELFVASEPARVIDGPNGPVAAPTGTPLSDAQVRRAVEAVRERM